MNYILFLLICVSPIYIPEHTNTVLVAKERGYAVGYGFNKAEAYGDSLRNTPSGVIKYPAQFIQLGPNKWKCVIRWEKK